MQGFPYQTPPSGWFQIGWSFDFPLGDVVPLHHFGRDLVAYRGESGDVHVLDAHCPHLGAHLGFGGKVVGDGVECPFHGWQWGADGVNMLIPGGARPNRSQRLACWSVAENCGIVLLWFHPEGILPTWEVGPLVPEVSAYHPISMDSCRAWDLSIHPQVVVENAVDSDHFTYVHQAADIPVILEMDERGPHLHVSQEIVFGAGRPKTWLTPDGPQVGSLEIDLWGVGMAQTLFAGSDDSYSLVAATPTAEGRATFRMTNWVPLRSDLSDEQQTERVRRRVAEQFTQAERDFVIWENMRYVDRAPLIRKEAKPYKVLRQWAKQFYAPTQVDAHESREP